MRDPRLRSWLIGQALTVPVSLVFVALWQEREGLFFIGVAVLSVYVAPYLPLVLWLSHRACGLALGWLAGLVCVAAYPLVSAAAFFDVIPAPAAQALCLLVPAAAVTATSLSARLVALPASVWPAVALGVLGVPVSTLALVLGYQFAFAPV